MAEYYAVLSKAVAGLETNTSEARRAVYDKARNALISQLKAIDPPLPTSEISRQRLELEEAIRRVERESASSASVAEDREGASVAEGRSASGLGGISPQDVFRRAINDAGRRGAEASPPLERAPAGTRGVPPSHGEATDDYGDEREGAPSYTPPRGYGEKRQPPGEPRLAPDYDWDQETPPQRAALADDGGRATPARRGRGGHGPDDAANLMGRRARPSRLPAMLLLVMIVVIVGGLAALGWSQREVLSDLVASFDTGADRPPAQATTAADGQAVDAVAVSGKDTDRLPTGEGSETPVRVVGAPAPGSTTETDTAMSPSVTAALSPGEEQGVEGGAMVAQKAVLYEEPMDNGAAAQGVIAINAAVTWSYKADGPDGPEISANIDVPERNMNVALTIRRNTDESLPASHLVEVVIDTPSDFPGEGIRSVPRLVLKESEEARGQPLIGATATITDGFFWIALSGVESDVAANLTMLRERRWIDLPMVYKTGQRAILTFEKGVPGAQVFDEAFAAWAG